jgi:hypothetical protein
MVGERQPRNGNPINVFAETSEMGDTCLPRSFLELATHFDLYLLEIHTPEVRAGTLTFDSQYPVLVGERQPRNGNPINVFAETSEMGDTCLPRSSPLEPPRIFVDSFPLSLVLFSSPESIHIFL